MFPVRAAMRAILPVLWRTPGTGHGEIEQSLAGIDLANAERAESLTGNAVAMICVAFLDSLIRAFRG